MSDRLQKIPSFDEVMKQPTQAGRVPSFDDIMKGIPVKKKESGGASPIVSNGDGLELQGEQIENPFSYDKLLPKTQEDPNKYIKPVPPKSIAAGVAKDKRKDDSVLGGLFNTVVGSVAQIGGGFVETQQSLVDAAGNLIDKVRGTPGFSKAIMKTNPVMMQIPERQDVVDFVEKARTASSSRENEQARSQFDITDGLQASDVKSLAFTAPKTIVDMAAGAMSGGQSFFFQSVNQNAEELEKVPEAQKLTPTEKVSYLFVQGTVQAALEKYGLNKILKATGLSAAAKQKIANEVTQEFIKKGTKATAKEIEDAVLKKVASLPNQIKRVGTKAAIGFGAEGGTEALQSVASDGIKLLTNKISEGKPFNEEDITANFLKNMINAGAQGGVFGGAGGGGVGVMQNTNKALRSEIAKAQTPEDVQRIQQEIAEQVELGNITQEEANAANITAEQYAKMAAKIPSDVSPEKKYALIGGIEQREGLKKEIESVKKDMAKLDESFHDDLKAEIELLEAKLGQTNDYLEGIVTGKKPTYRKEKSVTEGGEDKYYKTSSNGEETKITKEYYDLATAVREEQAANNKKEKEISPEEIKAANVLAKAPLPDSYKVMAEKDPVAVLKDIARQAQNLDDNFNPHNDGMEADSLERAKEYFGEYAVEKAMELYPKPSTPMQDQSEGAAENVVPSTFEQIQKLDREGQNESTKYKIGDKVKNEFGKEVELQMVEIGDITIEDKNKTDSSKVEKYAESVKNVSDMPPIYVINEGGGVKYLGDGHHRLEVAKRKGAKSIKAWVMNLGTKEQQSTPANDAKPSKLEKIPERKYSVEFDEDGKRFQIKNENGKKVVSLELMSDVVDRSGKKWKSINIDSFDKGKGWSKYAYQEALKELSKRGYEGIVSYDELLNTPERSKGIRKYFNIEKSSDENLVKSLNDQIEFLNKDAADFGEEQRELGKEVTLIKAQKNEAKQTTQDTNQAEATSQQPTEPNQAGGEAGEGKAGGPPISELPPKGNVFSERPATELSHRGLQDVANEFSLPDVQERETKTDIQLRQDARETVDDWAEKGQYARNVEGLVVKAESGEVLTDKQRLILEGHLANVSQELRDIANKNSPEYDAKLAEIKRLKDAGEKTRSEAGAALRIPLGGSRPKDIVDFMVEEMDISGTDKLTEQQKETVTKEYEDIEKAKKDFDDYVAKKEAEFAAKQAEIELSKVKGQSKTTKKVHADFVAERKSLKEELAAAKKEHDDYLKERGIKKSGFGSLTTKEAVVIAKIVKSYASEGVVKFQEVVDKVFDEIKSILPAVEKSDVVDVIAGKYNEKKPTRNQLAATMVDLKAQANLIQKLEALENGQEPTSEKKKIQRNKELKELRDKIKGHDLTKLSQAKEKIKKKIEAVEGQIKSGDFSKEEKKQPIKLDDEGNRLRDHLIKVQQQRDVRMLLQQRQNESRREKALRLTAEVANIPRTLMTIADFSGLLRQNIFFSLGHPIMTAKALPGMFKSFVSQKVYDRWFADLKESPEYPDIQKSGVAISDSLSHDLSKREEDFMSSLAEKIPVIGRTLNIGKFKVPGLNIVKGSERSYTMLLNKMRVDVFNSLIDPLKKRGLTFEKSPEVYKAVAEYVNNATGRSDFGKTLNRVAPVLNSAFFSPRLIASRMNMLTYWAQPRFYKTLPAEARKDYFRNWIALLGTGGVLLGLASLAGADVEEDPRSSDFGKIKDGNTRWDIWGGAQPYVRVLAQLISGERKSTKSGKIYDLSGDDIFGETRAGVTADFFRNKLAPVPGAAVDLLSGRTGIGEKIVYQWGDAGDKEVAINHYIKERLLPMTITGTAEAMKDAGVKAMFTVGIPNAFGVGTQTYGSTPTSSNKPTRKEKSKPTKPTKQD